MFKHQPGHISIMNTRHEINLTAILDLHVPLALSVTRMVKNIMMKCVL